MLAEMIKRLSVANADKGTIEYTATINYVNDDSGALEPFQNAPRRSLTAFSDFYGKDTTVN